MIQMRIQRDREGLISEFTLQGHAGFAEVGADIVCAAVSGITFGVLRAIETLLNVTLDIDDDEESGFLHCAIPVSLSGETQEKMQTLLEGMRVALQAVEEEYGDYVTIEEV